MKIVDAGQLWTMREDRILEGAFYDVYESAYHAGPGLSSSLLRQLLRSPAHYKAKLDGKKDENELRDSAALTFGRAAHCAVLEPDSFWHRFAVTPVCDRRTKAGKEVYEAWLADNGNKTPLSPRDKEKLDGIVDAVSAHEKYRTMTNDLEKVHHEATIYAVLDDVFCRVRPDIWIPSLNTIMDLKTTRDARAGAFHSDSWNHGYHVQLAFYMDVMAAAGHPVDSAVIIAVEKEAPFGVQLHGLTVTLLDVGRTEYQRALRLFKECSRSGLWNSYGQDVVPMEVPRWHNNTLEGDEDGTGEW